MMLNLKFKTHKWLFEHQHYAGNDCLIWPYSRARGYGNMKFHDKITYAHTVMCELVHGPPPTPQHQAAHSCGAGTEACVNPRHLSWKTPSENQLDKRVHGGLYRGGRRKKLTIHEVRAIRAMRGRATHDEMAAWFEISRRNIGAILDGEAGQKNDCLPHMGKKRSQPNDEISLCLIRRRATRVLNAVREN
jgi:hypothetical protein